MSILPIASILATKEFLAAETPALEPPDVDCEQAPPEEEEDSADDHPDYGSAEYWDQRYAESFHPFDWYQSWPRLAPLLGPFFSGTELALNIGCGNSPMAVDLGSVFLAVANIDISSVVIEQMRTAFQDHENLLWFTMDCTRMVFDDELFDVAFDKGTFDALFCGPGAYQKIGDTLEEIYRVLRPGGLFFEITYGKPEARMETFNSYELDWTLHEPVPVKNIETGGWHWIYIFQKTAGALAADDGDEGGDGEQAPSPESPGSEQSVGAAEE
jgi:SAM-dependent methyltransferase